MFKDKDFTENEIYEKLLNDKLSVNLGYLYENIVAQCLAANGNELFYHTIMNTQSKHNYEIDFILAKKNKIVPLEVKSSGYKTHKSLDVFTEKYSNHILKRYLVYTKDLSKEQDIFCIPVYMVPFLIGKMRGRLQIALKFFNGCYCQYNGSNCTYNIYNSDYDRAFLCTLPFYGCKVHGA